MFVCICVKSFTDSYEVQLAVVANLRHKDKISVYVMYICFVIIKCVYVCKNSYIKYLLKTYILLMILFLSRQL